MNVESVAVGKPVWFQMNERRANFAQLTARITGSRKDLFRVCSCGFNSRCAIAIGREKISSVILVSLSHNGHINSKHNIYCFFHKDSGFVVFCKKFH